MNCKSRLLKELQFNIPPIQRGLVWEPAQVINLWDSICKGYPIGAFLCYGDEKKPELLDGQQRYNAICMGLGTEMGKDVLSDKEEEDAGQQQAQLWVRRDPQDATKPMFMVCSSCHPWGFRRDPAGNILPLEHSVQAEANRCFLATCGQEKKEASLDDLFAKAPLNVGYPWYPRVNDEYRWFVPLPLLLKDDDAQTIIDKWYGTGHYGHGQSLDEAQKMPASKTERTLKGEIEAMLNSDWRKVVLATEVPVIQWEPKGRNLQELFNRINKGGSEIKPADLNYSSLCSYCADKTMAGDSAVLLKDVHKELCRDFLPPETLAALAARMVKLEEGESGLKTAALLKTDVAVNDIRKWYVCADGKPGESGKRFLALYRGAADGQQGAFPQVVEKFKKWFACERREGGRLPATVVLFQNELWLFVCLWTMMRFPEAFSEEERNAIQRGEGAHPNYFPLFCLLPQMLVGSGRGAAVEFFAKGFYEGLRGVELELAQGVRQELSLLNLMALGCANAALQHESCMHPYPWHEHLADEKSWMDLLANSPKDAAEAPWKAIFTKYVYGDRSPNLFLHYYQRAYVNYMLKQSNFNPGMRAHWEKAHNRPWDLDHIIPDKWWHPEDLRRHSLGNMQLLDFRANRSKQANDINPPEDKHPHAAKLHRAFSETCLRVWNGKQGEESRGDGMSIRRLDGGTEALVAQFRKEHQKHPGGTDGGASLRADYIINTLLRDLRVFDLLRAMSDLAKPECARWRSRRLEAIVSRYHFLSQLAQSMGDKAEWGTCEYQWATKYHYATNSVPACRAGESMNFYHSLVNQLQVGIRVSPVGESGTPPLYFLCSNAYLDGDVCKLEYGLRRGLGVSQEAWKARYKNLKSGVEQMLECDEWWHKGAYAEGQGCVESLLSENSLETVSAALAELRQCFADESLVK